MPDNYKKYSDAELVHCYQKGDDEAGNVLCQRYWIPLRKFFGKIIGNRKEDIEDLVQETFLEALKSLKNPQAPRRFRPWLYTIAKRVMRDWINLQEKQSVYRSSEGISEEEPEQMFFVESFLAPVTDQPEHETVDNELGDIRRQFEQTLQPKDLRIFHLRNHSSKTFEDIGEELDIRPGTAKVRYHRVRKKLKTWLKKNYPNTYLSLSEGGG